MGEETERVLAEVASERASQEGEWGREHDDRHGPGDWAVLVLKHLGRAAAALLGGREGWDRASFRRSLVVVAALSVAAVEYLDRNYGDGPA